MGSPAAEIGISTAKSGETYYCLRFHFGEEHLQRFKGSDRFQIRGQPANGFIIAPDKKGLKVSRPNIGSGGYLSQTLAQFELSRRVRKRINVRAEYENGHIRIPPLPSGWIDADVEFEANGVDHATTVFGDGKTVAKLHASPGNGISRVSSESTQLNGSPTAPLPKPTVDYTVPVDATMAEMQAQLAQQLNTAREIIKQMEARTGMKFVLDRNLRLVVAL
jgi:hypothetical protein